MKFYHDDGTVCKNAAHLMLMKIRKSADPKSISKHFDIKNESALRQVLVDNDVIDEPAYVDVEPVVELKKKEVDEIKFKVMEQTGKTSQELDDLLGF